MNLTPEPFAALLALILTAACVGAVLHWGARLFRPSCRRCLWCERLYDEAGLTPPADDPYVCGHGICPDCAARSRHDHPRAV